jgi:hypothetical protein
MMSVESMLANCRVETIQYTCLGAGAWEGFLPADVRRIGLYFPFEIDDAIVLPHTGSAPTIEIVPDTTDGYGTPFALAFFSFPLHGPIVCTDWWIFGTAGHVFTYTQVLVIKPLCEEKQEKVEGITWTTNLTQQAVGGTPVGHEPPPNIERIPVAGGFSQALNLAATGGTAPKLQMRQPGPTLASQLYAQQQQAIHDAQLKRAQDALAQYQQQSGPAGQAAAEAAYYASFGQKPPYRPTSGY